MQKNVGKQNEGKTFEILSHARMSFTPLYAH